jgi:hypothetical protein
MTAFWWTLGSLLIVAASLGSLLGLRSRRGRSAYQLERARKLFRLRREVLELQFLTCASQLGKPRGLAWDDCHFEDEAAFATDPDTGQLRAFVSVAIRFRAIEGGGMEDNPNVDNLRAATAVFLFDGRQWTTAGRAIFNLSPLETIERFQHGLEGLD